MQVKRWSTWDLWRTSLTNARSQLQSLTVIARRVAGAACLLLLAACASPSARGATAPPTATGGGTNSARSSSPSPTHLPIPVIAAHPVPITLATPEGAGEFARAFYAELDRALQTNDSSLFDGFLRPSCAFRQKIDRGAADRAVHHYLRTGGQRDITKMLAYPRGRTHLELKVESNRQTAITVDRNGRVVSTDPGHIATEQLSLDYSGDRWIVSNLIGNYSDLH